MGLDIRAPMGLMFTILGILVTGYGLVSDPAIYQRSLGINVNLWWGLVMLVFGLTFLYFGRRRKGKSGAAVGVDPARRKASRSPQPSARCGPGRTRGPDADP